MINDLLIGIAIGCITANLYRDRHAILKWFKFGRHDIAVVEYNIDSHDEHIVTQEKKLWMKFKRENPHTVVLFNGVELK